VIATRRPFLELLAENDEIASRVGRDELARLVDPANYLGLCGEMVDRVLAAQLIATSD
jgi:3-carboxy-cis,cis-muconate cycloisomerase